MKKIAFVIPSLSVGGMENVMSQLISYIALNKQCECHLILYGKTREICYQVPNTVFIHKPNFSFKEGYRIWYTVRTMLYLRSIIKQVNPYSILSFGEIWNSFVLLSLMGLKFSIYISDRCSPDKCFSNFHEILRKMLYPRASGIIVQTKVAKNIYRSKFRQKNIIVIGNPVHINNDIDKYKRENIVISIGRLIKTKNFDRLIDIFYHIDLPGWKLLIIGDDSDKQSVRTSLQEKIKILGIQDKVSLVGSEKDTYKFLLRSKIFAFTSSSEGLPNVILEAMSAGLPVVAYDCMAGPSELIDNGKNGFLIPLYDDKAFEDKLKYLMLHEDFAMRMGRRGHESLEPFSIDKIGDIYYEVLTKEVI